MMMYYQTKFSYKRFSKDIIRTLTEILNLCCDLDLEHSNPMFYWTFWLTMMIYPQTRLPCRRIISSENIAETLNQTVIIWKRKPCDHDLENSIPIFLPETPADDNVPPRYVCSDKAEGFRRQNLENNNLEIWTQTQDRRTVIQHPPPPPPTHTQLCYGWSNKGRANLTEQH